MKITSFSPLYGTENVDEAVDFFSQMGFAVKHRIKGEFLELCDLSNDAGVHINIVNSPLVQKMKLNGFFGNRMNVDDLQEAMEFLAHAGGRQVSPVITENPSNEIVFFRMPNGDIYGVMHHKKDGV